RPGHSAPDTFSSLHPVMIDTFNIIAATGGDAGYHLEVGKILAQVINFAIVAFILYRFGFKPVVATMDERQRKIQQGLDYAEEMKKTLAESEKRQSEILREAQQKSQEIIDEARVTAKALVEKQTQEANQRAEATLKKAAETIEQ